MDIESYISSGVLESYVLGTASDKERKEVECLSSIHEEIAQELQAIRKAMENYATAQSITPPAALKDKIVADLDAAVIPANAGSSSASHARSAAAVSNRHGTGKVYKIAAVMAVLLTATFAVMFLQNRADIDAVKRELAAASESRHQLEIELSDTRSRLAFSETRLAFFQDSATVGVPMKGIADKSPNGYATVYWNRSSKEVYLKVFYLPVPPTGKQYQLWGIVDGEPRDMGVFILTRDASLQKLNSIDRAQAFAVTLEPEGGSQNPTLSEMYMIGEV